MELLLCKKTQSIAYLGIIRRMQQRRYPDISTVSDAYKDYHMPDELYAAINGQ